MPTAARARGGWAGTGQGGTRCREWGPRVVPYLVSVLRLDAVAGDVEVVVPDLQERLLLLAAQEAQGVQRQLELGGGAWGQGISRGEEWKG